MHHAVARHRNTRPETLARLSAKMPEVDSLIARHPSAPKKTLQALAQHSDSRIRRDAQNTLNGWLAFHHISKEDQDILIRYRQLIRTRDMFEREGIHTFTDALNAQRIKIAMEADDAGIEYLLYAEDL